MKKIFIIIVLFMAIFSQSQNVFAVEVGTPLPTVSPSPTPILIVDYELPYPGILPGSPLYTIKIIKDRISDLLISDPIRKSNFYLLQADKRLSASVALFENGEVELGAETLSESIDYLEKSVEKMEEADNSQMDVLDILGKLKSSIAKHREKIVIFKLEKDERIQQNLEDEEERVLEIQNSVNTFNP